MYELWSGVFYLKIHSKSFDNRRCTNSVAYTRMNERAKLLYPAYLMLFFLTYKSAKFVLTYGKN